jgi:hypothetical protein
VDRATTNQEDLHKDKSDGSFKFTVSLIVFALTTLYRIYIYIQDNPIEANHNIVIMALIFFFGTTFILMCISLFMKAISLEVVTDIEVKYLERCAADFYLAGFMLGIVAFTFLLSACAWNIIVYPVSNIINILLDTSGTTTLSKSIAAFIAFSFGFFLMTSPSNAGVLDIVTNYSQKRIFLPTILSLIFILFFITYMLSSNIAVEMDDIYDKQNEQIPIEITITGEQYDNIVVNLSEVNSNNDLILIDSVKVKSDPSLAKICSSTYLTCDNLDLGKYKVFVNCTNLTKGYYELSVSTGESSLIVSSVKVKTNIFYLV